MMKTNVIASALAAVLTLSLGSCGTKQTMVQQSRPVSSFSGGYNAAPDAETDTHEYFVGTGFSYGSRKKKSQLQRTALTNAQDIIRQKLTHSYKGMVTNYMENYENDDVSDIQAKMQAAGTQVIDAVIADTYESATAKFSDVDEKGEIECVVNIRVYKAQMAEKAAQKLAEELTEDQKARIDYNESNFRKGLEAEMNK